MASVNKAVKKSLKDSYIQCHSDRLISWIKMGYRPEDFIMDTRWSVLKLVHADWVRLAVVIDG